MSHLRTGRRKYYDLFSHVYDAFIRLHARRDEGATRTFLVQTGGLDERGRPAILDICCGTGAVTVAFAERYPQGITVGYDFSRGMLNEAREKSGSLRTMFIEGDAGLLPFADDSFDVVTCSHALYELKGPARQAALREMKRVIRPAGMVLLMEHEVPRHPLTKALFYIRMAAMGAANAEDFVKGGLKPFQEIFPEVSLTHSPSGKSKLVICRKKANP